MPRFGLTATLLFCALAAAQSPQAVLQGVITDASGAAIPGAQITVTNISTGVRIETKANAQGRYYLPYLTPSLYEAAAEHSGFEKTVVHGIELTVNQVASVDMVMKLGEIVQQVTVEAQSVELEKDNATLGTVIDNREINDLPLLGRNPYALIELVPGARASAHWNELPVDETSQAVVSINGARGNQSEFLLDGAPNTSGLRNNPVIIPSVASVEQFKVETNGFSAEFGRAAGGVVNVVTKSGTNQFRGEVYEFFRNDITDASDFFANRGGAAKPELRYNQFGAALGGPIKHSRTFFFANYEGVRTIQGLTFLSTVPMPLQRNGDFSQTFFQPGQPIAIYDPATTGPDPANASRQIRAPFPGNRIPVTREDRVAANLMKMFPGSNTAGSRGSGMNNFVAVDPQTIAKNMLMGRVDHYFTSNQRIYGRYSIDRTGYNRPDIYHNIGSPSFGPQNFHRQNFVVNDVYTLGPTSVAGLRYSLSRLGNENLPRSAGTDLSALGYPPNLSSQLAIDVMPTITISGMGSRFSGSNISSASTLGSDEFIRSAGETHAWGGDWTKVLGRQTIKTGAELRVYRMNTYLHADQSDVFNFNAGFTQGPNPAAGSTTAGLGLASFFLGLAQGGRVQLTPALAMQQIYYAGFIQDDWQATRKLSLNLGLRYEYGSPLTDRFNQLVNFDYNTPAPLTSPYGAPEGALTFVGVNGAPRGEWNPDRKDFAPRFGLAYAARRKLVIRAGAGIFYAPSTGNGATASSYGTSGFQTTTTYASSLNGLDVLRSISNPYPDGVVRPTGSSLGPATLLGQAISFADRNRRTGYAEQWSFSLQGELPGRFVWDASYAGSRGLHIAASRQMNQLSDETMQMGDALRTLVPNPFNKQITQGAVATQTIALARLLRPFPQFDNMTAVYSNWGASGYNALWLKLQKSLSHGVSLMTSFSWSKSMGNVNAGEWGGENLGSSGVQDWNNLRSEWAVSELDISRRFVASYTWNLPFGRSGAYLRTGVLGKIAGGWQIAGVTTLAVGVPLGSSCSNNTTFSFGGGCRPNLLRSPVLPAGERTADRWFDTTAFAQPTPITFGNAGRTIPGLRGSPIRNADLSLARAIRLAEWRELRIRLQGFNVSNTVRFAVPNQSYGTAAFGTINAQLNHGRVMQAAVTLRF